MGENSPNNLNLVNQKNSGGSPSHSQEPVHHISHSYKNQNNINKRISNIQQHSNSIIDYSYGNSSNN